MDEGFGRAAKRESEQRESKYRRVMCHLRAADGDEHVCGVRVVVGRVRGGCAGGQGSVQVGVVGAWGERERGGRERWEREVGERW
jgi:hypothetical protein